VDVPGVTLSSGSASSPAWIPLPTYSSKITSSAGGRINGISKTQSTEQGDKEEITVNMTASDL
jgi:hypothetical protein